MIPHWRRKIYIACCRHSLRNRVSILSCFFYLSKPSCYVLSINFWSLVYWKGSIIPLSHRCWTYKPQAQAQLHTCMHARTHRRHSHQHTYIPVAQPFIHPQTLYGQEVWKSWYQRRTSGNPGKRPIQPWTTSQIPPQVVCRNPGCGKTHPSPPPTQRFGWTCWCVKATVLLKSEGQM